MGEDSSKPNPGHAPSAATETLLKNLNVGRSSRFLRGSLRVASSLRRWGSLIACGALSGLATAILLNLFPRQLSDLADQIRKLPPLLGYLSLVLMPAFVFVPIAKGRVMAWLGFRYFWAYPPLWIAVLVGLVVLFVLLVLAPTQGATVLFRFGESPWDTLLAMLAALAGGLLAVCIAAAVISLFSGLPDSLGGEAILSSSARTVKELASDPERLVEWLQDTRPVSHPDDALFGHAGQARRIAARLRALPTKDGNTEAAAILLGPRGSGKTTIGKLVRRALLTDKTSNPKIAVSLVSAWPYETSDALLSGIIDATIREIKAHVNVLGLTGLSSTYIRAARAAGGPFRMATELIEERSDPTRVLKRLEPVLAALDLRIVLWIDDLERYADVPEKKALEKGVKALLDQFNEIRGVTFVLASEDLGDGLDLSKLGMFVERVCPLDVKDVESIVSSFRKHCLEFSFIDPAGKGRQDLTERPDVTLGLTLRSAMQSLAAILNTPRGLKHSLRRTWFVWKSLVGEIDFDDVLIMDAIREQAQEMFLFVNRNLDKFRSSFDVQRTAPFDEREKKAKAAFHSEYQEAIGRVERSIREQVDHLIRHVFSKPFDSVRLARERPQALAERTATDYWYRYWSEALEGDPARTDQKTLKMIQDWIDAPSEGRALPQRLVMGEDDDLQVEQFGNLIPPTLRPTLLLHTVHGIISREHTHWKERQGTWDSRENPPGFVSIWRMLLHGNEKLTADTHEVVGRCLTNVVGRDLRLANDLMYWFGAERLEVRAPSSVELRKFYVELVLKEYTEGSEQKLILALDQKFAYVLVWLLWPPRDRQQEQPPRPELEAWRGFCKVLLSAAGKAPDVILPQIAVTLTNTNRVSVISESGEHLGLENRAIFDEERAKALFDLDELMPFLAALNSNSPLAMQDEAACREVQRYASAWIAERSGGGTDRKGSESGLQPTPPGEVP